MFIISFRTSIPLDMYCFTHQLNKDGKVSHDDEGLVYSNSSGNFFTYFEDLSSSAQTFEL